jgi:dihydropteroate synthase
MSAKDTSTPAPVAPPADVAPAGADTLTRLFALGRPLVMGVLNVTPDSFSDGGRFLDPAAAIEQAHRLAEDGADIIDIGAESTRPYGDAAPVDAAEERRRLEPVIDAVIGLGVPVSIDTMKAEVAAWALDRGVAIANDVWGLQRDAAMADVVAARGAPVIVMHNRDKVDETIDILADMDAFFTRTIAIAEAAGIARDRLVLDPGIGFGKTPAQSLEALAGLPRLARFGLPILVGASRKRFIDFVSPSPPDRRLGGSIAAHLLAVLDGANIVRVHDVAATVQALKVAAAIRSRK